MVNELNDRKTKLLKQLDDLEKQPQIQAEKKGKISEGLRISEHEKIENESTIKEVDKKIDSLRFQLNETQEKSISDKRKKS